MTKILVNPTTNEECAVIDSTGVTFTPAGEIYRKTFRLVGITIPTELRANYGGKRVVYYAPNSAEFAEAFNNISLPTFLKQGFLLKERP